MTDLAIVLDEGSGKHLYQQIYEYIAREIKGGKLLAGEKLPSTRSLAEYLQVARSTVELAYEQLLSEGYIESAPYRGYFICRVEELYRIDTASGRTDRPGERAEQEKEAGYEIDFSPNAIDMSCFPFSIWRRITREILGGNRRELFALGEPRGDLQLRETICRYLHSSRGVNASPRQVIVGAGNDYLLVLLQYILGRQIRVAFENPSYRRAYRIFSSFASETLTVPSDDSGMQVEGLEKTGADVAYVMPSHQYPTGRVMPIGRRLELLRWAAGDEGRYLIEDDYDSEFRYRGKPVPSLQSSDTAGKVIYIGTFSKSIAPAIRISFMVLPVQLLARYEENCAFFSSTVSRIDQTILNEFIQSGAFERHLNRMRKVYREKHDILLEELKPLLTRYRLSGERAGLHVLLTSREPADEETLTASAAARGVRIYGLKETALAPYQTDCATLLLGFAGLDGSQLREGVRRLREVL